MNVFKKTLIGAGFGAIVAVMGSSAAMAAPIFTVDGTSINGTGSIFNADGFSFTSFANIMQTAPGIQTETGYAFLDKFTLGGSKVNGTGLVAGDSYGGPGYGVYFTFAAQVSGVNGFGPGAGVGTIDSFTFNMYADPNQNTATNVNCGFTTCTVGGTTSDDLLLATSSVVAGAAGFQEVTGAPTFSSLNLFNVTDPAGLAFFISPDPFYNLIFNSTTGGSFQDVHVNCATPATCTAANLNGFVGKANFVPEPLTLSVFGAGLFGAAALRRRRKAKKA